MLANFAFHTLQGLALTISQHILKSRQHAERAAQRYQIAGIGTAHLHPAYYALQICHGLQLLGHGIAQRGTGNELGHGLLALINAGNI